jgi:hypothetical protein
LPGSLAIIAAFNKYQGTLPKSLDKWDMSLVEVTDGLQMTPFNQAVVDKYLRFLTPVGSPPSATLSGASIVIGNLMIRKFETDNRLPLSTELDHVDAATSMIESFDFTPIEGDGEGYVADFVDTSLNAWTNLTADVDPTSLNDTVKGLVVSQFSRPMCVDEYGCTKAEQQVLFLPAPGTTPSAVETWRLQLNNAVAQGLTYCMVSGANCKRQRTIRQVLVWANRLLLVTSVARLGWTLVRSLAAARTTVIVDQEIAAMAEGSSATVSAPPRVATQKFWSNAKTIEARSVRQRDSLIDLRYTSSGKFNPNLLSNAQRMRRGCAPISSIDDRPIELHHMGQQEQSTLIELTSSQHDAYSRQIHIHAGDSSFQSVINRPKFNRWKRKYWGARLIELAAQASVAIPALVNLRCS